MGKRDAGKGDRSCLSARYVREIMSVQFQTKRTQKRVGV